MSLETKDSSGSMLALHDLAEHDINEAFTPGFLARLKLWMSRKDQLAAAPAMLDDPSVSLFCMNVNGQASDYFPDPQHNPIIEDLFREFAEGEGELQTTEKEPRCVKVSCRVINEAMQLVALLCPFFDDAGDLKGFVIVHSRKQ